MFQLIFCARTGKQFFFRVILRFLHTCLYRYIMFLHLHQHVERLLEIDRNNQMSNSEICKMEITRNKKRDSYLYIQQTQNRSRPLEMTSSSFKTTPGRAAESHFYSMLNEPLHSKWLKYVCQVLLQNFVMYVLSGGIISATLQCSKKMCKIQCWWDMMLRNICEHCTCWICQLCYKIVFCQINTSTC